MSLALCPACWFPAPAPPNKHGPSDGMIIEPPRQCTPLYGNK